MISLSSALFAVAFFAYLAGSILYVAGLLASGSEAGGRLARAAHLAQLVVLTGAVAHGVGILFRWWGSGQWPTSNMFEFVAFMAFCSIAAFLVIDRIYRLPYLGALATPIGVIMLGYASVFPREVRPLVAALQSYWLHLHVSTVALGEGFFAVAFGAALLYLLRTRGQESKWGGWVLEGIFWTLSAIVSFVLLALVLRSTGAEWVISASDSTVRYHLPPIIGPAGAPVGQAGTWLGLPMPLMAGPGWMRGKNLNTLLFSLVLGTMVFWALRALIRAPFRVALGRLVQRLDPEVLDEIGYRAIAIGYPIFTLGGLVFAMMWAKVAWNRYWAWDPKEVWALITWLVYSGYLHLRINRGWEGRPSAWTAVLGFAVVIFTLVGVNLLIVGLHSYVGGD